MKYGYTARMGGYAGNVGGYKGRTIKKEIDVESNNVVDDVKKDNVPDEADINKDPSQAGSDTKPSVKMEDINVPKEEDVNRKLRTLYQEEALMVRKGCIKVRIKEKQVKQKNLQTTTNKGLWI